MRENQIEAYLRNRVKELGGKAYKFVSPGNNGVPDRLVCLPGGRVVFVELKALGKRPTAIQRAQHRKLREMGFVVFGKVDCILSVDIALGLAMNQRYVTQKDIEELEMMDVE